jgi:hypothetical protein
LTKSYLTQCQSKKSCFFADRRNLWGASKKGGIMVAVLNGLDIRVYQYHWLPLGTDIPTTDISIFINGHIGLGISVL